MLFKVFIYHVSSASYVNFALHCMHYFVVVHLTVIGEVILLYVILRAEYSTHSVHYELY